MEVSPYAANEPCRRGSVKDLEGEHILDCPRGPIVNTKSLKAEELSQVRPGKVGQKRKLGRCVGSQGGMRAQSCLSLLFNMQGHRLEASQEPVWVVRL